ncbi:MAG: hypothetical protein IJP11_03710 [Oscillospiraceae bacterium]|nr:hypothetical protein [Oscillospiraceae bacterium]
MKKLWIWIILLILLIAAAAAVIVITQLPQEPETPEDYLQAAREKMSQISSMRFQMTMDMDITALWQELDVNLTMDGEMTSDPAMAHGDVTMDMAGKDVAEMEVYMEADGDETVSHVGVLVGSKRVWSTQRGNDAAAGMGADLQAQTMQLLEMAIILADTEPEAISETELRYTGVIPASKIRFALQTTGLLRQLEDTRLIDEDVLDKLDEDLEDMPLTVTVDKEQLVITGYSLDMTSVVRQLLRISLEDSMSKIGLGSLADDLVEVANVTTQMKLYDFDLVEEIVIPDYVRNPKNIETEPEQEEAADEDHI